LSDFKLDFSLVLAAAELRPNWQWIFIGKQREGQRSAEIDALAMLPNVHFLGYRPYASLPDYLRDMDVGVLPSLLNEYTRAMFPMKYFEYLAAGLRVVSTPLAFMQTQANGAMVAGSPSDFVGAIEQQLRRGRLSQEEAQRYVGENTWIGRMEKMMKIVDASGVKR
jgi:glycosyltransferase involved in cell wall biosynthesis